MERGDNESKGLTRTNRRKVVCSACGIHLNNDNKNIHVQRRHPGMKVNFLPLLESGQQTLNFWGASKTLNIADIRNENNNNSKAVDKSAEDSSYSDAENNTDVEVNEFADLEVGKVVAVENDKVSIVSTDEVTVSDSNEVPALEVNKVLEGEVDMVTETELANMAVSNVDTSEAHIEADADMVLNLESEADMTVEKSCAAEMNVNIQGSMKRKNVEDERYLMKKSVCNDNHSRLINSAIIQEPHTSVRSCEAETGPIQPKLEIYDPKIFQGIKRDFQYKWFQKYPWLSFSIGSKVASCYCCSQFSTSEDKFIFSNWKKEERLVKHAKSQSHIQCMLLWMNARNTEKNK